MRFHSIRGVLVLCLALAVALVPAASPVDAQGKGTLKIATQSPLSGGQAALGEGIKLGAQLAIEKFKGNLEKAGWKVELVPFDDQAKPDVGVANARNIIADKDIIGIVGHLNSGVAIPSSPGFIGTYQWLGVSALALFDVGTEQALAFSILMQAVWYVPTLLVGGVLLVRRGIRTVRRAPARRVPVGEVSDA